MLDYADILIVDDDEEMLEVLSLRLTRHGWTVRTAETGEEGLDELRVSLPDAVLLDVRMPGMSGLETLKAMRARLPRLPVVFLSAASDAESIVEAMRLGAFDYVVKPPDPTKLITTLSNAVRQHRLMRRLARLEREAEGRGYPGLLGQSPAMRELYRSLDRVADTDITLLIRGESGTGKQLVARAAHTSSSRRDAPFFSVNCAALTAENEDAEIFGTDVGAARETGPPRRGWFEQANGGTLYLESVVDLPKSAQGKLLRVLQERSLYRLGGLEEIHVDVRLVAGTDEKLRSAVARGTFREDLFFRLNAFEIEVPALRMRGEDVLELAGHFLRRYAEQYERPVRRLSDASAEAIRRYAWPGNVRELESAVRRAALLSESEELDVGHLPPDVLGAPDASTSGTSGLGRAGDENSVSSLQSLEASAVAAALRACDGNVSAAARRLGISRSTLYRKMKAYGVAG